MIKRRAITGVTVYPENGKWAYRVASEPNPLTGKRIRPYKGGFPSEEAALRQAIEAKKILDTGRSPHPEKIRVHEYFKEWLRAIEPNLKNTAAQSYRDINDAYIEPILGTQPGAELVGPPDRGRGRGVRRVAGPAVRPRKPSVRGTSPQCLGTGSGTPHAGRGRAARYALHAELDRHTGVRRAERRMGRVVRASITSTRMVTPLVEWIQYREDALIIVEPGSFGWHNAYLLGLCGLGLLAALLREPGPRRALLIGAAGIVAATAVAGAMALP